MKISAKNSKAENLAEKEGTNDNRRFYGKQQEIPTRNTKHGFNSTKRKTLATNRTSKLLQVNLHHVKGASAVLSRRFKKVGLGMVLLQEPWSTGQTKEKFLEFKRIM